MGEFFTKSPNLDLTAKHKKFIDIKEEFNRRKITRDRIVLELKDEKSNQKRLTKRHEDAVKVSKVFQKASERTQKKLEKKISSLVTMALEAVFPDPYEFGIKFVERRNQIECDLIFKGMGMMLVILCFRVEEDRKKLLALL